MNTELKTIGDFLNLLPAEHKETVIQDYTGYLDEENPLAETEEIEEKLQQHLNKPCDSLELAVYSTKDESRDEDNFQFWYELIKQYEPAIGVTVDMNVEPKMVYAVITYRAFVPGDMNTRDITEAVEKKIEDDLKDFSVYLSKYNGQGDPSVIFDMDDVSCGETVTVLIG